MSASSPQHKFSTKRTGDTKDYQRDYRAPMGDVVRGASLHKTAGVRHLVCRIPVSAGPDSKLYSVGTRVFALGESPSMSILSMKKK